MARKGEGEREARSRGQKGMSVRSGRNAEREMEVRGIYVMRNIK